MLFLIMIDTIHSFQFLMYSFYTISTKLLILFFYFKVLFFIDL